MTQIKLGVLFVFFKTYLFKADKPALMGTEEQKVRRELRCCCRLRLQRFRSHFADPA